MNREKTNARPHWFNLDNYLVASDFDASYTESMWSLKDRLGVLKRLLGSDLPSLFRKDAKCPDFDYKAYYLATTGEVFDEDIYVRFFSQHKNTYQRRSFDPWDFRLTSSQSTQAPPDSKSISIDAYCKAEAEKIMQVTRRNTDNSNDISLGDVMRYLDTNQSSLSNLEAKAQIIAEENSWNIEEVRYLLFDNIPFSYLMNKSRFKITQHPPAKESDVRKVFKYRVAAWLDLMLWSAFEGIILKKSLIADVVFPPESHPSEEQYTALDFNPSRPIGQFYDKLVSEPDFINSLISRAEIMDGIK